MVMGKQLPFLIEPGVNKRPKVHFCSCPTCMEIIYLPGQPFHIMNFSFSYKHKFSENILIFVNKNKFGLEFHFACCSHW